MKADGTPTRLDPASPAAIDLAREWAGKTYRDEAEALLALELAFEKALHLGTMKLAIDLARAGEGGR